MIPHEDKVDVITPTNIIAHRGCRNLIPHVEGWRVICALKSGSSVHTDPVHLYTHIGFICTHIPGSSVHTELSGDGVGWGGLITFMFLCTHTDTANLIIFLLSSRRRHLSGDGVGWGDNVHVPVHTQAHPT